MKVPLTFQPKIKLETLKWDREYWESYLRQYENNEIQCSPEQRIQDIMKVQIELKRVQLEHEQLLRDYAEEFI